MLEKDCNGNPIYLPTLLCISHDLATRLIESLSHNVRNKKKALKRLCVNIFLAQILDILMNKMATSNFQMLKRFLDDYFTIYNIYKEETRD